MKVVGVRELKARLTAYLRDVASGETVLISVRGRVIAELRSPAGSYPATPIGTPLPEGTARSLIDWERDDSSRLR